MKSTERHRNPQKVIENSPPSQLPSHHGSRGHGFVSAARPLRCAVRPPRVPAQWACSAPTRCGVGKVAQSAVKVHCLGFLFWVNGLKGPNFWWLKFKMLIQTEVEVIQIDSFMNMVKKRYTIYYIYSVFNIFPYHLAQIVGGYICL